MQFTRLWWRASVLTRASHYMMHPQTDPHLIKFCFKCCFYFSMDCRTVYTVAVESETQNYITQFYTCSDWGNFQWIRVNSTLPHFARGLPHGPLGSPPPPNLTLRTTGLQETSTLWFNFLKHFMSSSWFSKPCFPLSGFSDFNGVQMGGIQMSLAPLHCYEPYEVKP